MCGKTKYMNDFYKDQGQLLLVLIKNIYIIQITIFLLMQLPSIIYKSPNSAPVLSAKF